MIVGNSNVGKTNILSKYCDNIFIEEERNTIGVDFKIYDTILDDKNLTI